MKNLYLLFSLLCISFIAHAQDPFITTWEVEANDLDITIPTVPTEYSYDYTIDFGDGTVLSNVASSISHTYASAGTYSVEITGTFPAIRIYDLDTNDKLKLRSVEQWGDISWQTMYRAFNDAYNLVINATDAPDLSQVTNMSYMFVDAWNFNQSINHWDVSNAEDMAFLFSGATAFNQPLDNWDVSNVTEMAYMFYGALVFNQPINSWDVSSVTGMSFMFAKDISSNPSSDAGLVFNQPLDNWDVSSVTSMTRMFSGTENFNQPLNSWDVSNVIWMDQMFSSALAFNQPLNSWTLTNIFTIERMFTGAINFNGAIGNWDVSNIEDMSYLFSGAESFNQLIDGWDVSSATTMAGMFRGALSYNQPLNSWDVSNVTQMFRMFENASSFNQPLDNWNVSNVESMRFMFRNAVVFNSSIDTWDLSGIVQNDFGNSLSLMFSGAIAFNQPLNLWNVSSLTSLKELFIGASAFNKPLDSWDVSNVENMSWLFTGATAFNQPLNNWDVSSVTHMTYMFRNASSYNQPLNNWDLSNVTSISYMFDNASSFNQPLDNWNVGNVVSFNGVFNNATAFNQPLHSWDFTKMGFSASNQPGLANFINNTSMSIENYDALLQHLVSYDVENLYLGAEGLEYCNTGAVDYLVNQLNWTISGHSLADDCNTVSGSVYLDSNNNGCDASDVEMSNYFVFFENSDNLNVYGVQIIDGSYTGGFSGTNFTASIQALPDYIMSSPVDAVVNFSGGSTEEIVDFCLTASQAIEDLSVTLIPTSEARPGFESTYQLIVENIGTEFMSNVVVDLSFDDAMQSFVSAMPIPDVVTSDNLQFNFASIDPFQSETIDIILQIFTPPTVNGDDILVFDATVSPDNNDYSPNNNSYNVEQIVVNSFDPNDINVLQGETITTDQTGEYLDYVIRFQNTGTASAINVEVQSLLHQNLNGSTFRVLSSSHSYVATIENNIITFNFDNIFLPDETSDPEGSNGFIAYRLKPKSNIQIGEVIDGIAAIYFDFNEPIITNMVSTEVINPLGVDEFNLNNLISLYPNPASNKFYIEKSEGLIVESIQIYDLKGSQLLHVNEPVEYINTAQIESGIYTMVVSTDRGRLIKKLIIN
jgi:uncharacterized repeat protein (TIGR01451 family)